ncbi:MAG: hypothetical protein Q8O63_09875 [Hoeflea sp.]|nr:hypothetical protein [Hoeflea sp.]
MSKRAELDGMRRALRQKGAYLKDQIAHIDHVLVIFGYKGSPQAIKPKQHKVYRFKRRELSMLIRQFEGGTNRDVALRIIEHKGWDAEDRDLVAKISDSVKSAKQYRARMAKLRSYGLA